MMFRPLCALFALLCGVAAHAAAPKPRVFCADGSPEGFDPSLWDSVGTSNVTRQIFQGLLGFARGGTALEPKLATAWAVSPDAKTFAFTLRRGVRFHATPWFTPRREFNADDVLFTFTRLIDPALPYNRAFPATFVYAQSLGLAGQIEGIDKLGDHEVRFRLKSPNVTFLSYFAMSFAGIHSAEYAAQLLTAGQASAINNRPVGTGPFKLKSYKKDDVVRMVPHQAYWRPVEQAQQLSQLIFAISREPSVRVQKLAAGECHVSAALDIAIDRNALFKVLFPRGDAMQAVSAFPPAIPGYNTALKNEYDPARAKALLAQAGHAEGFEIELWALPMSPNGSVDFEGVWRE